MKTSPAGIAAIRQREGCVLHWYKDVVGIKTALVGHTEAAGPPFYDPDKRFTLAEADQVLAKDLLPFEATVGNVVKVHVSQNQFDAMVSLAFNIGSASFANSSVVRRLNQGDISGAADAFLMWDKAGGRVIAGLARRRQAERGQFLSLLPIANHAAPVIATPGPVAVPVKLGFWQSFWKALRGK